MALSTKKYFNQIIKNCFTFPQLHDIKKNGKRHFLVIMKLY